MRNVLFYHLCICTVGYFYPDGIIKYDGSWTQIDGTISKKTLILLYKDTTQKFLDRLADSTASPFATLQLLD
jgi:hypothetical protein